MERVVILKNTVTGMELTMPVTPSRYPMEAGRAVERLDMAQTGQIALPGLKSLFNEPLEVMLPAQQYPFLTAGAVADPWYYLDLLTAWSSAGDVCRYIVSGTSINAPVLIGPISYGEQDGTNDVYAKIPLYEYRYLDEVIVEKTQNTSRPVENNNQKATAGSYVVAAGDSLWAICKKFYGDGSLAYKLAEFNGIKNANIIKAGQTISLPDASVLGSISVSASQKTNTKKKETVTDARTAVQKALYLHEKQQHGGVL